MTYEPPLGRNARVVAAAEFVFVALLGEARNVFAGRVVVRVGVRVAIEKLRQDFRAGNDMTTTLKYSCEMEIKLKR